MTEITARELHSRLERPNNLLILDVRVADSAGRWQIEGRYRPEMLHIPYFKFVEKDTREAAVGRVPKEQEVIAVCAHGGASEYVAMMLSSRGLKATNLVDGMDGWARLHIQRPVVEKPSVAIYQFDRAARGCLSYVIISDGQAIVIDPSIYVDEYTAFLAKHQATLDLVIDTHAHADHVSGGTALAHETGVPYFLHPYDAIHPFDLLPAAIPFEKLDDDRHFQLGAVELRTIYSPGHTLGHVVLLATDADGQGYLFSGDSLFINSVGRPDLGGQAETWSELAHRTLFTTLDPLPPSAVVLPGHYAGPHEANEQGTYAQTLETVRRVNPDMGLSNRDEFVQHVLANLPPAPAEYAQIKRINIGLETVSLPQVVTLELGRNICALSPAYEQTATTV